MGFLEILTLILITLKLCGVIAWSWLWVLSPLWIGYGIALSFLVIGSIFWLILRLIECLKN
jgi:hypothetical protein